MGAAVRPPRQMVMSVDRFDWRPGRGGVTGAAERGPPQSGRTVAPNPSVKHPDHFRIPTIGTITLAWTLTS